MEEKQKSSNFLFEHINKCNNFLAVFGLSTLIPTRIKTFTISYYRMGYSALLVMLLLALFCLQGIYSYDTSGNIASIIMRLYLYVVGNMITALIVFSSITTGRKCASMQTRLIKINSKYSCFAGKTPRSVTIKHFAIPFSIFLISLTMDIAQYSYLSELSLLIVASVHISLLYNILLITQFSLYLYWLKGGIKAINDGLDNLLNSGEEEFIDDGKRKKKEEDGFDFYSEDKKKEKLFEVKFSLPLNGNVTKSKKSLETVKNFRILYHDMYELTQEINQIFGTRILLTVGHNFILGVIFLYTTVGDIINIISSSESSGGETLIPEVIFHIKWSILSFLSIFGLIWPSRMTSSKAYKTVILVHELLITPVEGELKSELHCFALQFLHDHIAFSPHGFFNLNNKLLLSILGAVASYLVVLIQFRIPMK